MSALTCTHTRLHDYKESVHWAVPACALGAGTNLRETAVSPTRLSEEALKPFPANFFEPGAVMPRMGSKTESGRRSSVCRCLLGDKTECNWVHLDDISSEERRSRRTCVTRVRQHSHTPEMTDFVSCFEPQSLAVDAATMLEAFHSYAYELYVIARSRVRARSGSRPCSSWPSGSSTGVTAPG